MTAFIYFSFFITVGRMGLAVQTKICCSSAPLLNLVVSPVSFPPQILLVYNLLPQIRQSTRLFSCRPNRDPPTPSLQASVSTPPLVPGGGEHTRWEKRGRGVPIQTRGQTLWYYYVLCAINDSSSVLFGTKGNDLCCKNLYILCFSLILHERWAGICTHTVPHI